MKFEPKSISLAAVAVVNDDPRKSMYCTSVNPSLGRNSPATKSGAPQMPGSRPSLSRVVSGGGSAATGLGCTPRSPAIPASVTPPRNRRRLNRRTCWLHMRTSLPDVGHDDTEDAGQWTLLPSHERAQHLTLCRLQIVASTYGYFY